MPENKINYDFIEIGTSNFHTLIEDCSDDTIGLSIEPIQTYLNDLPNKPNVTKVNAAISDQDGEIEIYNIPLSNIRKYNLPIWVKGTNSVLKPHEYARQKLGEDFYDSIVSIDKVPTISWKTLISQYSIKTIDYLKIDTEGHDHVILKSYFEECVKNPRLFANKILFEYNESSDKIALDNIINSLTNYEIEFLEQDILLKKIKTKHEKSYVLYANEQYFNIVRSCVKSIREFSELPIFVYLLDSDLKIDLPNVKTIRWDTDFSKTTLPNLNSENYYIDRSNFNIYKLLIQRPAVVKHALENYSDVVAYVDSDSVATQYCDRIFEMYNPKLDYPYFAEGIYEYLHINGRGGAESRDDLSTTLEHPACELFGANQYIRQKYRQTGYFVASDNCIDFLDEWYWMCNHPKVLKDFKLYAPYHEETLANVLLWKYNHLDGLPYIYTNGDNQTIDRIFKENLFTGTPRNIGPWFKIPATEKDLLFVHGEKRNWVIEEMIERLKIRASGLRNDYNIEPKKNWGDILSQFLLEHYSGKKLNKDDVFYFDDASYMLDKNGKIVGIGSSMKYVRPDDYVWGTGCIDTVNIGDKPKKIYSVRGPLTRDILLKRGWDVPEVYGDPAILFPRVYNPTIEKKYKIGLIPHCVDFFSLD
jgi:FkbM family methyltransferase